MVVEEENDGIDCSAQDVIARTRSKLGARCLCLCLVLAEDRGLVLFFLDDPSNILLRPGRGNVGLSLGRSLPVTIAWSFVME